MNVTDEMIEIVCRTIAEDCSMAWPGDYDANEQAMCRSSVKRALEAVSDKLKCDDRYEEGYDDGRADGHEQCLRDRT